MADEAPVATPMAPVQQAAIANAGAGPLSDLARQAKGGLMLDSDSARCYGAGFVPDLFRASYVPTVPPPPIAHTGACVNISNANPTTIQVSAADYPFYPVGTKVTFVNTTVPLLDNASAAFIVQSVNNVGKSFKINCDLTSLGAPVSNKGSVNALAVGATILTEPPPAPPLKTVIPNGYEQWAADTAKENDRGKAS